MSLIIILQNDGTGQGDIGNYDCSVWVNRKALWQGRLENHKRRSGWEVLVQRLADAIMNGKGEHVDAQVQNQRRKQG